MWICMILRTQDMGNNFIMFTFGAIYFLDYNDKNRIEFA